MKRITRGGWPALVWLICLAASAAQPAAAGDASAIGPCSPIAGPDGDIRSELPGCRHRSRPEDGSLGDEMAYRRGRHRTPEDGDPPRGRRRPAVPDDDEEE